MTWEKSIEEGKVIKITPNLERAKSLIKISKTTSNFAEKNKIEESTAGVLLRNYYESLVELLHAISHKEGFKVLDHLSFTYYLQEKGEKYYSYLFDKYRKIRNSAIYYGKPIKFNTAKQGIADIKEMIKILREKYLKNL